MTDKYTFENPFGNIFIDVLAQENVDAVASPTLPIDPNLKGPIFDNVVQPTSTPTQSVTETPGKASAKLSISEDSGKKIGETVKVKLEVESGEIDVSEIKFVMNYNPNRMKFLKIEYVDTYLTNSKVLESDDINGTITISAKSLGEPRTLNRTVATINLEIKSSGASELKIDETKSSIINKDGQNVLLAGPSAEFLTEGSTVQEGTKSSTPSPSTTIIVKQKFKEIPKSDLSDYSGLVPLTAGLLLVAFGAWLGLSKKKKDELF